MGSPIMDRAERWAYKLMWRQAELYMGPIERKWLGLSMFIVDRLEKQGMLPSQLRKKAGDALVNHTIECDYCDCMAMCDDALKLVREYQTTEELEVEYNRTASSPIF